MPLALKLNWRKSIHHRSAKISSARFGDPPAGKGLSTVVYSGTQPGISDQLFGGGKAGDIPNGCQDHDACQHGHSWVKTETDKYQRV